MCKGPMDDCSDHEKPWYPQRAVCHKTMVNAWVQKQYDDLHEAEPFHDGAFARWSKERDSEHPFHYRDGVHVWMSDVDYSPDDDFLGAPTITDEDE